MVCCGNRLRGTTRCWLLIAEVVWVDDGLRSLVWNWIKVYGSCAGFRVTIKGGSRSYGFRYRVMIRCRSLVEALIAGYGD